MFKGEASALLRSLEVCGGLRGVKTEQIKVWRCSAGRGRGQDTAEVPMSNPLDEPVAPKGDKGSKTVGFPPNISAVRPS